MRVLYHHRPAREALRRRWRRRLGFSLLVSALGGSGVAYPHSLQELLDLPVECLLQLRITSLTPDSTSSRTRGDLPVEQQI